MIEDPFLFTILLVVVVIQEHGQETYVPRMLQVMCG